MDFHLHESRATLDFPMHSMEFDPERNRPQNPRIKWGPFSRRVLLSWDEGAPEQNGEMFRIYRKDNDGAFELKGITGYREYSWHDTQALEYGGRYTYRVTECRTYPEPVESAPAEIVFYPRLAEETCTSVDVRQAHTIRKRSESQAANYVVIHRGEHMHAIVVLQEYQRGPDAPGWRAAPAMRVSLYDSSGTQDGQTRRGEFRRKLPEENTPLARISMPGGQGFYKLDREPFDVLVVVDILRRRLRLETLQAGVSDSA